MLACAIGPVAAGLLPNARFHGPDMPLDAIRQQIRANYLPDEDEAVKRLSAAAGLSAEERKAISARAACRRRFARP